MIQSRSTQHLCRIWFDGGCKPNPGRGYGSYQIGFDKVQYGHRNTLIQFGLMTNNMAEYTALLHGLKKLWHDSRNGNVLLDGIQIVPDRIDLHIFSDSKLLVHQLNGRYRCKVAHLQELIDECRLVLKEFGRWKLEWQPRKFNMERFGH